MFNVKNNYNVKITLYEAIALHAFFNGLQFSHLFNKRRELNLYVKPDRFSSVECEGYNFYIKPHNPF